VPAPVRGRVLALACAVTAAPVLMSCTASSTAPPRGDAVAQEQLDRDLIEYLERPGLEEVRAVVVSVGDRIVFEEYRGGTAEDYHAQFSVTKSIVSTLVGIAVDEGLLDVDQTLAELLPDHVGTMDPAVAGTTLEQLLTMTGGFPDSWTGDSGQVFEQPNWVVASLASAAGPPGERFTYSDPGAHLVGAILVAATGEPVLDYARDELFGPLGIDSEPAAEPLFSPENAAAYDAADFAWAVDPQGLHAGGTGLKLRAPDMIDFGRLFLHGGRWDGEQVVSEAWVREATAAQVSARHAASSYGYFWWVDTAGGSPAYFALGFGGQLIEVVPELGLVVAVCTRVGDTNGVEPGRLTNMVDDVIAPALG
jgi:CubicO group peptidase (beta-lactamase class C family)